VHIVDNTVGEAQLVPKTLESPESTPLWVSALRCYQNCRSNLPRLLGLDPLYISMTLSGMQIVPESAGI